ncbi:Ribonuclease 3, partial [Clarias magur]
MAECRGDITYQIQVGQFPSCAAQAVGDIAKLTPQLAATTSPVKVGKELCCTGCGLMLLP